VDDSALLRYSRQILLPGFDIDGQQALLESKVLVVGLGGLGSSASLYLAAGGVGQLVIADADRVELSNLQRQILYRQSDLGTHKAVAAQAALEALNPECQIEPLALRLSGTQLEEAVERSNLVLDCVDNFETRRKLNIACWQHKKPLVSAAALGMTGQLTAFDANTDDSPCYECLYEETPNEENASCSENGVLGPVVGLLGSAQAIEAIKILAGVGEPLVGRLLVLDATTMDWHCFRLSRRTGCQICGETRKPSSALF